MQARCEGLQESGRSEHRHGAMHGHSISANDRRVGRFKRQAWSNACSSFVIARARCERLCFLNDRAPCGQGLLQIFDRWTYNRGLVGWNGDCKCCEQWVYKRLYFRGITCAHFLCGYGRYVPCSSFLLSNAYCQAHLNVQGFGLGPTFGALLVRATNNVIAPFYITIAAYILVSFVVAFIVPESLSEERQAEARIEYERAIQESRAKTHSPVRRTVNRLFRFLRPLTLFFPRNSDDDHPEGVHIMRTDVRSGKRDYSLTLVAAAYGVYSGMFAILSLKMLYSQHKYGKASLFSSCNNNRSLRLP